MFLNETVLLNRRQYCWIGDQESYKMLEEDKSSELQERFLQVNLLKIIKITNHNKKKKPFGTDFFFFLLQYNHLLGSFFTRMAEVDQEQRKETK